MPSPRLFKLKLARFIALALLLSISSMASPVQAQDQMGFLGEIRLFAGNYQPQGFMFCDGRLLSPAKYEALFSILGCTYGGDCLASFALPDLRGRVPLQSGSGPNLTKRNLGDKTGAETASLDAKAQGQLLSLSATPTGHSGNSLTTSPPSLSLNYIICVQGVFPDRPY